MSHNGFSRRGFLHTLFGTSVLGGVASRSGVTAGAAGEAPGGFAGQPSRAGTAPQEPGRAAAGPGEMREWADDSRFGTEYLRINRQVIEWPDKATRDAAFARMEEDARMMNEPMPFDGKRMIFGGFTPIVTLEA